MADGLFGSLIRVAALLVVTVFAAVAWDVVWQGIGMVSVDFLADQPANAGRSGGIGPILVSTLLILAVAMAGAIPMGLACAIWLSEYLTDGSPGGRAVRVSLDALAGVPSIVFGLFGNAFFSVYLGLGYSILSGGLTLACMVLPIFVRTAEAGLRGIGTDWRRQAAALGMTRASVLLNVLLPAASPAIVAGIMLGVGRATAETAALVFTSGYVDRWPGSLQDSGRALSVHIYDLSMNVTGGDKAAYGSALVLMAIVVSINAGAVWASDRWAANRITTP